MLAISQGTQRLRQAYEDHPDMGNTKLVRPQEAVLGRRLNSLGDQMKRLEVRLIPYFFCQKIDSYQ
ncbi:unnamed protein product [Echinostoma caproni]|uniref:Transposase n=1 Tax=Echinostoma caproni TaxID=27848 RepID=A0A183B7P1_9TREM|nr:unnamed protein product [Echinostoma caproni]